MPRIRGVFRGAGLALLLASSTLHGASATVVSFNGDYTSANNVFLRGLTPPAVATDLDGDGSADDSYTQYAFSETVPLSPVSNYTGPLFYGGARGESIDDTSRKFGTRQVINSSAEDRISLRYQTGTGKTGRLHLALFFDKADFVGGGAAAPAVRFAADSQLALVASRFENLGNVRWLVRDGAQFYVSQATLAGSGATLSFAADNDDGQWAAFDPAADINFNQVSASFVTRDFQDITAIGLLVDKDAYTVARHWLEVRAFTASAELVSNNTPPVAAFSATPQVGALPLLVAFDASASSDADGTIASYAWDFGDGATGSGIEASHTYAAGGIYTATLTVTDNGGATATAARQIGVTDGAAVAIASFNGTGLVTSSQPFRNANPATVPTDLDGDGAADDSYSQYAYSETVPLSPSTNYSGPAFFGAVRGETIGELRSLGERSVIDSANGDVFGVRHQPGTGFSGRLHLVFYIDKADFLNGGATSPVKFDYLSRFRMTNGRFENLGQVRWLVRNGTQFYVSEAIAGSGGVLGFARNDDDGRWAPYAPGVELNFDQANAVFSTYDFHDITAVGLLVDKDAYTAVRHWLQFSLFEVTAFVGNGEGTQNLAPVAAAAATPNPVKRPNAVSFSAAGSSDYEGEALTYAWDFGDGAGATGISVNHTYLAEGTYTAAVTATDPFGNVSTPAEIEVEVLPPNTAPVASFATTPTSGEAPLAVSLDATASSDSDGNIATYAWDFGDGTSATGVTAQHTYVEGGQYTISLTVVDNDGASHTATQIVQATVNGTVPPTATFAATPTNGLAPLIVAFDGTASSDPDGTIVGYNWDFGDGNTATGPTAQHTYVDPGTYVAMLTVTDNSGGSRSATRSILVFDPNNAGPTDNPVETGYGAGAYPWTGEIKWHQVFNVTTFPGADDMARYEAARDAAVQAGGGVVYFPAGTYTFTDHLYLADGVVIRGDAPTITDAKDAGFLPPTRFEFPQYIPSFTGSGSDTSTAFKQIFTLNGDTDSNLGLVYIDLNRARINLQGSNSTGTNRNYIVYGVRSNNVALPDGGIPQTYQNGWQRWSNRFATNISVTVFENALVANNRINDAVTDNFEQPGYIVEDTSQPVGTPERFPALTGPQAVFSYTDHYGIYVNRGASVTYGTPETAPSLFRTGIVIRDNWVYATMRVKIHAAGNGLVIADNVLRDNASKAHWVDPTGRRLVGNANTLENRGIDWSGHNVVIVGNDVEVFRHRLKSGPYYSVDGEGILHQECCGGSSIRGLLIEDNTVNSYIGLYKSREIENVTIRGNLVTSGVNHNFPDLIYVNADTNNTAYYVKDVLIEDNTVESGYHIRLEGDAAGGGTGNVIRNNTSTGSGNIKVSTAANATVTGNTGFTTVPF